MAKWRVAHRLSVQRERHGGSRAEQFGVSVLRVRGSRWSITGPSAIAGPSAVAPSNRIVLDDTIQESFDLGGDCLEPVTLVHRGLGLLHPSPFGYLTFVLCPRLKAWGIGVSVTRASTGASDGHADADSELPAVGCIERRRLGTDVRCQ